jgi:ketosteroid isomerase-like protein
VSNADACTTPISNAIAVATALRDIVFRDALEAMKNASLTGTTDIREINVLGDWAYIRNFIEITIAPPNGNAVHRRGYTLSILRKQSHGKWVLWRDANLVA